jgi:hypothetical protein
MLGRELRLPDSLLHPIPSEQMQLTQEYVVEMAEHLQTAHNLLRDQQKLTMTDETEEPLLYQEGDLVWLRRKRKKRGESNKLCRKYVGPYKVIKAWPTHT